MAGSGRLQADPLFQGLTRPPMLLGVTYMFFLVNGVFSLIAFIHTSNFVIPFVVAPMLHGIAYLICMREPRAIELFVLKTNKGMKCANKRYHGYTNSYDIY